MTQLEDLVWLYKMALQFDLEDEKAWLKEEIESLMNQQSKFKKDLATALEALEHFEEAA